MFSRIFPKNYDDDDEKDEEEEEEEEDDEDNDNDCDECIATLSCAEVHDESWSSSPFAF